MQPGSFTVIRTDGSEETFAIKPTIQRVRLAIGADALDTVQIGKNPANGPRETVMMLDDLGSGVMGTKRKPVNEKATALYHSVCRPGTTAQIHGDVAIVNDEDFA